MGNYFNELRWKIIRAINLLQFMYQVTIEIRFRKSLAKKSIPRDHRLSSLSKTRDTKRLSLGRIFLSYPHAHDRFLNYLHDVVVVVITNVICQPLVAY